MLKGGNVELLETCTGIQRNLKVGPIGLLQADFHGFLT